MALGLRDDGPQRVKRLRREDDMSLFRGVRGFAGLDFTGRSSEGAASQRPYEEKSECGTLEAVPGQSVEVRLWR